MSKETKGSSRINISRRKMLKFYAAGLFAGVTAPVFRRLPSAFAAAANGEKNKVLTIYYSRTGNTSELAGRIHQIVGGDIMELQTMKPYPDDYEAVKKQARQELNSGYRPPLKTKVDNLSAYDVIFVGSPIWWGTAVPPAQSFLSESDLSGKIIAPFVTHLGSRLGRSVGDIARLCPDSTVLDGLAVRGPDVKDANSAVTEWVSRLGLRHQASTASALPVIGG